MKLYALCLGSYRLHEPEVCDCFITIMLAEDLTQARIRGRKICEKRYAYQDGWDEAGGVEVMPIEQGMEVGQYSIDYLITDVIFKNNNDDISLLSPSIFLVGVTSHYWWFQDEYAESLLSFTVATDISEAKKIADMNKDKLFALVDEKWSDSYAIAALRLQDVNQIDKHYIQWSIQKLEKYGNP